MSNPAQEEGLVYIYIYIYIYKKQKWLDSLIGWGCRIHRLNLSRGVQLLQQVSWHDTKQSDGEAPVMPELWRMGSIPLLPSIYLKEPIEYIQNQIDKIRDSVEDRQSRIAWQTINEASRRNSTAKAKLKATKQQDRIKLWTCRIYKETHQKLHMNQSQELLVSK